MNNLLTMLLLPVIATGVGASASKEIPKECFDNDVSYVMSESVAKEMSAKFDEALNRAAAGAQRDNLVQNMDINQSNRNVIRQDDIRSNDFQRDRRVANGNTRMRRPRTDIGVDKRTYIREENSIENSNIDSLSDTQTNTNGTNSLDSDMARRAIDNVNDATTSPRVNARNNSMRNRNRNVQTLEDRSGIANRTNNGSDRRNNNFGRNTFDQTNNSNKISNGQTDTLNNSSRTSNGQTGRNRRYNKTNYTFEINQLNNEFSRMFELAEELSMQKLEMLPKKLEFQALKRQYIDRLSGLLPNENNSGSKQTGEDLIFLDEQGNNTARNSNGIRQDRLQNNDGVLTNNNSQNGYTNTNMSQRGDRNNNNARQDRLSNSNTSLNSDSMQNQNTSLSSDSMQNQNTDLNNRTSNQNTLRRNRSTRPSRDNNLATASINGNTNYSNYMGNTNGFSNNRYDSMRNSNGVSNNRYDNSNGISNNRYDFTNADRYNYSGSNNGYDYSNSNMYGLGYDRSNSNRFGFANNGYDYSNSNRYTNNGYDYSSSNRYGNGMNLDHYNNNYGSYYGNANDSSYYYGNGMNNGGRNHISRINTNGRYRSMPSNYGYGNNYYDRNDMSGSFGSNDNYYNSMSNYNDNNNMHNGYSLVNFRGLNDSGYNSTGYDLHGSYGHNPMYRNMFRADFTNFDDGRMYPINQGQNGASNRMRPMRAMQTMAEMN